MACLGIWYGDMVRRGIMLWVNFIFLLGGGRCDAPGTARMVADSRKLAGFMTNERVRE